jgi:methyl coenzyme M reductase alpha subunit
MTTYQTPKPKKTRRGIPILGLLLAVSLAAAAYGVSFPLVQFGEEQSASLKTQFDDLRDQYQQVPNIIEIITAAILWFVMMGIGMFIVSASLVGTDADKEAFKYMPPSPADKKAMVKQMKKDLKDAKRRAREMDRKKK